MTESLFCNFKVNYNIMPVHPYIFRIGIINDWKSRWCNRKQYKEFLKQDLKLRDFILKKLNRAGIDSVEIERSANSINVIIKTTRPGLIIGRSGSGAEEIKREMKKMLQKEGADMANTEVRLEIQEVKDPASHANVVAQEMASQIERRMPYRRVIKQTIEKIMQSKDVQGAKVMVKGRLNGTEIARKEWLKKGKISLQTLRSNIDYADSTAYTTYGTIGIKVWISKGEVFDQ